MPLFLASLALHGVIAIQLARTRAFTQFNVVFDSDPSQFVSIFMTGSGAWNPKHPNMGLFLKWGNYSVAKLMEFLFNST